MDRKAPPSELTNLIRNVYEPLGLAVANLEIEKESSEYGACRFNLNQDKILFRVAKITPTKLGQFVTLWKRGSITNIIEPIDLNDNISYFIINVADSNHSGLFIFDQEILAAKKIISQYGKFGKRAIRVYPPWVKPVASEAIKSQAWQLKYFVDLEIPSASEKILSLLNIIL